jgi:hypothetical protein
MWKSGEVAAEPRGDDTAEDNPDASGQQCAEEHAGPTDFVHAFAFYARLAAFSYGSAPKLPECL